MILVSGDVVLDHNLYEGKRLTPDDREARGSQYLEMPGDATHLWLTETTCGRLGAVWLAQTNEEVLRKWPEQFHTRATWHLVANGKELKDGKHWALNQQLGYGDTEARPYPASLASSLPETPSILVLDNAGLGFRDAAQCWPDCLKDGVRPEGLEWVVLKMRGRWQPRLWEKLKTTSGATD